MLRWLLWEGEGGENNKYEDNDDDNDDNDNDDNDNEEQMLMQTPHYPPAETYCC